MSQRLSKDLAKGRESWSYKGGSREGKGSLLFLLLLLLLRGRLGRAGVGEDLLVVVRDVVALEAEVEDAHLVLAVDDDLVLDVALGDRLERLLERLGLLGLGALERLAQRARVRRRQRRRRRERVASTTRMERTRRVDAVV